MFDWQTFRGSAEQLSDIDLPRVGALVRVGEDKVHAVMDVEAAGDGYDYKGRNKMLRETHWFYRLIPPEQHQEAFRQGVATTRWVRNYPRDSYPDLQKMISINRMSALQSCSWGLGQIMGFNYKKAGYPTPDAMIEAFGDSEANQLQGMIKFILNAGLDDNLRKAGASADSWRGFALGYNGESYASHNYHGRLANSYNFWTKIPDTPYIPGDIPVNPDLPPPDIDNPSKPPPSVIVPGRHRLLHWTKPNLQGIDVSNWQRYLRAIGYTDTIVDGTFGKQSHDSTSDFQRIRGLTPDGKVGIKTMEAMAHVLDKRGIKVAFEGLGDTPAEPSIILLPSSPTSEGVLDMIEEIRAEAPKPATLEIQKPPVVAPAPPPQVKERRGWFGWLRRRR